MNTNTKKAVIDCLINQDSNKLSNRLAHLVPDEIINILANGVIVVEITKKPTFDNIREVRSFANDYGKELTRNGIQCAEHDGILHECSISLRVDTQEVSIIYKYKWKDEAGNHEDYDYLNLDVNLLLNDKRFEFKTI